ncbi:IS3 family transposase [Janibacter hoylei]|uniref:IS3 family transposase n=1 Tax=Janibacter hoylei TaxID=364298 RepID=UPI00223819FC|nr:IS3 family transposase [Janibacter hoylei]MCW4600186.1 IS3 family transposase [Janibacter hoylei]MCW4602193.1 IS3 family transposase [Janibacter hoylei]MCW4602209.1 IS3 family transposase [Janibacter hoylei]
MPKKIDPKVKERCVRQVLEHLPEYPSLTAAAEVVARREGVGKESVRRWVLQAQVDGGQRQGATTEELAQIKELKAKVRRLEEDNEILRRASNFLRGGTRPPRSLIVAFIDEMRTEGHAVESICRVLREQGCQIAARTYRQWAGATRPVATRTITDAIVTDRVRDLVWTVDHAGVRRMTPEGLYGRRKMTALVKRADADTSPGSVDRAMRTLGLQGVRRAKGVRTTIPAKDGTRAGDLLDRDFTAEAPNRTWVMDFTYVRTWAGFVYVAFVLDVFAQKIVAWNVAATKAVELVDVPVRMALWQRGREGHPVVRGELIGHADAGSQYTSITFTDHLADEGIRPSIGSVADAYDNALMECVIGLFKTECIRTTVFHPGPYRTIAEVEYATAGWVDWYNNRRLHSTLEMMTPVEYEQVHYAALTREPQPV